MRLCLVKVKVFEFNYKDMVVGRLMAALVKKKIIAVAVLGRPNHVTEGSGVLITAFLL